MIIPQSLLDLYHSTVTDFNNINFGVNCKLYYPSKPLVCPNCYQDTMTNRSTGIYKSGGPVSFTDGMICPVCNGEGFKSNEVSDTIKMRVYYEKAKWIKIADNINSTETIAQIFGKREDTSKVMQAEYILLHSDSPELGRMETVLDGKIYPYGLSDGFFVGNVKAR